MESNIVLLAIIGVFAFALWLLSGKHNSQPDETNCRVRYAQADKFLEHSDKFIENYKKSKVADLKKEIEAWKFACDVQAKIHATEKKELESTIRAYKINIQIAEDLTEELTWSIQVLEAKLANQPEPVKEPIKNPLKQEPCTPQL